MQEMPFNRANFTNATYANPGAYANGSGGYANGSGGYANGNGVKANGSHVRAALCYKCELQLKYSLLNMG